MTEWLLLATSLLLMLACGVFVAAEFSFVTVDRATIERAAAAGDKGAQGTLVALRSLSTQLSGAQLGITITNLAIGFLAEPAIGKLLHDPLESLGLEGGALRGSLVRDRAGPQHRRHDAGRRARAQELRAGPPAAHRGAHPVAAAGLHPRDGLADPRC